MYVCVCMYIYIYIERHIYRERKCYLVHMLYEIPLRVHTSVLVCVCMQHKSCSTRVRTFTRTFMGYYHPCEDSIAWCVIGA